MHTDQGDWILTEGELAAVAESLGVSRGLLDAIPRALPEEPEAVRAVEDFQALDPPLKALMEKALAVLASPGKTVRLNTAVADTRVSRSLLAASPDMPDVWVSLAGSGDRRHVSLRSEAELRLLVARHLAADDGLSPDRVGADLSTHAVLALLAACAQIRRARLISLLRHEEAAEVFTAADIRGRLQEAATADFRWPLSFVAPLIPLPVGDLGVTKDPRPALVELARAGFIEPVSESDTPLFEMSPAGRLYSEGLVQEASRCGLSVTRPIGGDQVAYDVLLLCRGPFNLFGFFMSGEVGFATTLLAGDLDELAKYAFSKAEAVPAPARPAGSAPAEGTPGSERTVLFDETARFTAARLVGKGGALKGQTVALVPDATLGRKEGNEIVVNDPGVSRQHAKFTFAPDGWSLTDLGSSNGTFLNETKMEAGKPARLKGGDVIRTGGTVLAFEEGPLP